MAQGKDTVQVADKQEEVKVQALVPQEQPLPKPQKEMMVTIATDESAEGKSDVFVGYNYKSYLIKRGEPVKLPEGLVETLRNTVADTRDGNGNPVKVPRFNLTVEPV